MAVSDIRIEMNSGAAQELLKSAGVQADLERRGKAIAAAAGGEPDFEVSVSAGATRARVTVRTATMQARVAEAKDRSLTAALDAGR